MMAKPTRQRLCKQPQRQTSLRRFIYDVLHNEEYDTRLSRWVDWFLITLILANVACVILGSVNSIYQDYQFMFDKFENFSIAIFTAEFLLRFWSAAEHDTQHSACKDRLIWLRHPHGIIDLIAIAPAYINFFVPIDLRYLIVLRLLRLFKLTRYFVALRLLLNVVAKEKESFKAVLLILMILVVLAASGIHLVEHEAQPEKFDSIPKAMWWAVVTLTTVGYGDVTPITPLGKTLGAIITILGVGLAALPAGILASGLANELSQRRERLESELREHILQNELDITKEADAIEALRQELGLSKEQAQLVVDQILKEQALQKSHLAVSHYCPNCGHALTPHPDSHR